MTRKLVIVKLIGIEGLKFGTAVISAELRKAKGIPSDAKELRRYRDVFRGEQAMAIVFEHPSFPEVEDGGMIPAFIPPKPLQINAEPQNVGKPKEGKGK